MTEEQMRDIVKKAICPEELNPVRFYHLCWWQDKMQCLPVHHTTASHPVFLSMPGQILRNGLSIYQWRLLTGRLAYFGQLTGLSLDPRAVGKPVDDTPSPVRPRLPMTELDWGRLTTLLAEMRTTVAPAGSSFWALRRLLVSADVIPGKDIPPDVVTMNSRMRLRDQDGARESVVTLVFPPDARGSDFDKVKLSILTHTGMALLGRKTGATVMDCLTIAELLYQPEAAGDFNL